MQPVKPGPISIDHLSAEPYADSRRLRIKVDISGEGQRPNLELLLSNEAGNEIARSMIVETMDNHTEFTMHIGKEAVHSVLTLTCRAYFEEDSHSDMKKIEITI